MGSKYQERSFSLLQIILWDVCCTLINNKKAFYDEDLQIWSQKLLFSILSIF